jgi:glycerophosphoryl diester phosphodiesterase
MIVAHRGASFDAPENTLSAFQEAWKQHADGIEGDFYLTKDQQIVCIHDKDTLRTTGQRKLVAESTLRELRELEYGSWKDDKFSGEQIPTFAEVLQSVPDGKTFVIELKAGVEIVPVLKQQIETCKPDRAGLLIIGFDQETIAECKKIMPDIRAHWLTGYKQSKLTGAWTPTDTEVMESFRQSAADGIGMQGNREVVTPAFMDKLKQSGLREFHIWTVDDPADAAYFRDLGAIGITTNRPAFLRAALEKD